jgi:hypothetical protein
MVGSLTLIVKVLGSTLITHDNTRIIIMQQ